jgi:prolyl-tRNA synthetase
MMILEFYRQLIEEQLAVPVMTGYKTDREKFVGALYTTTLEAMMPDGKALQMGTSHNLGQNFSKPFEIKYLGKDEESHYAWTTSWGTSWRLISAMVMLHGDDKGLIIPPGIAPIQIVIVPIYYKEEKNNEVSARCRQMFESLTKSGFAVHLDLREQYTPGWKFNEWELKGVPLRMEIGPRDVEKRQVTLVRRDNSQKVAVEEQNVVAKISETLEEIQTQLATAAKSTMNRFISHAEDFGQLKKVLEEHGGFIRACWCGDATCEDEIKAETGATIRTVPFAKEDVFSNCVRCGKPATKVVYFARAY